MKQRILSKLPLIFSLLLLAACQETDRNGNPLDTPTSGTVSISVDETLKPLIETELQTFNVLYPNAHVNVKYLPEQDAVQQFLRDTLRLVIMGRQLNAQEMNYFKSRELPMRPTKIAYDAVALIVNNKNPDSTLTVEQVGKIFKGQVKNWNELDKSYPNKAIKVVFDNSASGTVSYLKDFYKLDSIPQVNFYALKTNPEVIDYVEKTPDALGIIGLSWISDRKDSVTNNFLSKIKVLALSPPDTIQADEPYYQPYQAYVIQHYYPFVREVYINSRELWAGLGTGFASFVAGDKGQMIVRLTGLVPATMPIHLVEVKKSF